MVLCEMAMFPTDKGASVSRWVARVLSLIDESGLPYQLTPMGTIIEGEWKEVMDLAGRCFEALRQDCERVYISMHIDYRKGGGGRMKQKVEKVSSILGRSLSTAPQGRGDENR
ncbi:MAG: MTH1187 family thiamine-binding protein [Bacteroidota bacterium]|nr:MTH1187 family thiamine-binding protein [Bacteroidota bacterium]